MRITRRHLLALGAATAVVGTVGAGGLAIRWWDQPAEAPFKVLSTEEASIIRAIAGAAYPATTTIEIAGENAGLDRFFDALLEHVPDGPATLLKLLLHGLDGGTVLSHGSTFTHLAADERTDALQGWTQHDLAELRNASQSLLLLLGMGWSIHPEVAPTMQRYHNCGYGA